MERGGWAAFLQRAYDHAHLLVVHTQVLYTSKADLIAAKRMERGGRSGAVAAMAEFVGTACCRRKCVLGYFGEKR